MIARLPIAGMLACVSLAFGQTAPSPPEFDTVSVKLAAPGRGETFSIEGWAESRTPGRLHIRNYLLINLLGNAFEVSNRQIFGPNFLFSTAVDIDAIYPKEATKAQFAQMLRKMLADRFGLKVQYERTAMDGYALTIDKNGHRLRQPTVIVRDEGAPPEPLPSRLTPQADEDGFPIRPVRPGLNATFANYSTRLKGVEATMTELVKVVSNVLKKPVTDETELSGTYDFLLTYSRIPEGGDLPGGLPYPPLLTALPAQLGLRLVRRKILEDKIVIDHIEKAPSEN